MQKNYSSSNLKKEKKNIKIKKDHVEGFFVSVTFDWSISRAIVQFSLKWYFYLLIRKIIKMYGREKNGRKLWNFFKLK